jgi:WD40 repeat protein
MQKTAISNQGFKVKAFKKKLKRHKDAVLSIHSPNGISDSLLLSGSADNVIKIWDLENQKTVNKVGVNRPSEEILLKYTADDLPNYSEDHVLNTDKALKKQREQKTVC